MLPSDYKPTSSAKVKITIDDVKRRIADYARLTADEIGWSVEHLITMRKRVKDAISQRHVIIARHRRAMLNDRRIEEMKLRHMSEVIEAKQRLVVTMKATYVRLQMDAIKLRHMQEMSALRAEVADAVAEFDRNPDVALHQSIDGFFPGLIEGFAEMDRRESEMWREYREQ